MGKMDPVGRRNRGISVMNRDSSGTNHLVLRLVDGKFSGRVLALGRGDVSDRWSHLECVVWSGMHDEGANVEVLILYMCPRRGIV
jgi:hypothetical protein